MPHRNGLAYAAVFTAAFGWALSPVFMRYLSAVYDPYTQAFVRYAWATASLIIVSSLFFRGDLVRLLRRPWGLLGIAGLNVIQQTAWTVACYHTTATTAVLVTKFQIPLVVVFSFIFFHEERAVIRSFRYLAGTALGVAGVVAIVTAGAATDLFPNHALATVLLLTVALCWAIYAVWGKHLVMDVHPVPMFTIVAVFTTTGFALLSLLFGTPSSILAASSLQNGIAFISGLLPIAIAHAAFHYGQKYLGSAFSTSLTLLSPLITHLIALLIWPDEPLNAIQWSGAAGLLCGSYLVILAQRRASTGGGSL